MSSQSQRKEAEEYGTPPSFKINRKIKGNK